MTDNQEQDSRTQAHAASVATTEPAWERKVLEDLVKETLKEKRSRRRWSIFFRCLGFAYVAWILIMLSGWEFGGGSNAAPHTAIVSIEGEIGPGGDNSAENVVTALQSAFEDVGTKGVVLRINSPGGSPVQSGMVYDEIHRLRKLHPQIPLYVVVEDMCASGGYYIAAAADRIYVDKASIVGSIGVLMDGFGFTGAMDKLGVERRLLTAGENKGFLDPFSPQSDKQRDYAKALLADVHKQFIAAVREGRGTRLKETPDMFSGLFWTGARSVEMGLADEYGTVDSVARDVIKAETLVDYTQHQNFAERFAKRFGAAMGGAFVGTLNGSAHQTHLR